MHYPSKLKQEFHDQIKMTFQIFTVMRDFNAHTVGCNHHMWLVVIGSHSVGSVNENKPWLLSFHIEFGLTITNAM